MASSFATTLVAIAIVCFSMVFTVLVMMPFAGALIRLRANYNPRAVGFDGADNQ